MNLEKVVPTLDELVDHFRAQAKRKGLPSRYWIVESHKHKKDKVEPKIEMVTTLAQDLKRAEAEVKEMKQKGEALPVDDTITSLKPQALKKRKRTRTRQIIRYRATATLRRPRKTKKQRNNKTGVSKPKKLKGWEYYK